MLVHFYLFLFTSIEINAQTLQAYLLIASKENPELKSKYTEFEAALQKVPQVATLPDPTASLGVFVSPVETRVGPQRARLSISQLFPWFGTLEARKDAATAMAQVKLYNWLDARNQLFFNIRKMYYQLYELEKTIGINEENLQFLDTYEQLAITKFQAGKGTMVDVVRVQIQQNELKTNIQLLKDKRQPLLTAFNKMLNRSEADSVNLPDTLLLPAIDLAFLQDSLMKNPKLTMLDAQRQAWALQEQLVGKERMPKIGVGLDYVLVQKRSDMNVPGNGKDVLMPMLTVSLPIWGKKYDAMKQEAALMQKSAEQMKQNVANTLTSQWAQARYDLDNARQRLDLFAKQTEATRTALDLLITAYANSGSDFVEVLRTEQTLLQYHLMSETACRDYMIAYAQLEYLTAKQLVN